MDDQRQPTLSDQFRQHFGHRGHLYGVMLADLADDLDAGGPTARICSGHEGAGRADAIHLRLLAGIFRIVLRGEAPGLVKYYPSLAGSARPDGVWADLRPVLEAHVDELHEALTRPPQTNEPGRSACLAVGLFEAVRRTGLREVQLWELGASAGLNLNVDRYRMVGPGWSWGPHDSPLRIDTGAAGVHPEGARIVDRHGCDLDPVDASTPDGGRYLTSFVWPFDVERHRRLAAALQVARAHPVAVDRASASTWLEDRLREPPRDGVLTVVWQSVTGQYWPAPETERVEQAVDGARGRRPIVHLIMEGVPPTQDPGGYDIAVDGLRLTLDGDLIARSHHHGPPVVLAGR